MWDTSIVTLQTSTTVNDKGSIKQIWVDLEDVECDVQFFDSQSKQLGFNFADFGATDVGDVRVVYDNTLNPNWKKGNQVRYNGKQWWVKYVDDRMDSIGLSNHIFVILVKVI